MAATVVTKDQLKEGLKGLAPFWQSRVVRVNTGGEMIINCDFVLPEKQAETLRSLYREAGVNLAIAHSEANNPILYLGLNKGDARLVYTHRYTTDISAAKINGKALNADTEKKVREEANRKMGVVIGKDLGDTLTAIPKVEDAAVGLGTDRTP